MSRNTTSPYKGRVGGGESMEGLVRSLERENLSLVDEINVLKAKTRKVVDLETQIDMVLKHNTQLLNENQRLAKLMSQKKGELEAWRTKCETQAASRSANSEHETRKLIAEIEKLKEEITQIQHIKNLQISQIKNQNHSEIQNIKKSHLSSNQRYELEIRRLKQYSQKKQYEISDLNMKLVRLTKETDFQIGKLRQEKDRLRGDLIYEETQHKKEVEGLKNKFDHNFHAQIDNIKKQHLNQVQALDYENSKLKDVINSKNVQIEQILTKNLKVKNNYEDSIDLLKRQNEELKNKLFQTEHNAELDLNNLRQKLDSIKDSQLGLLRHAHDNQLDLMTRQVKRLQGIIDHRNSELQHLAKQKNQIRQDLQADIARLHGDIDAQDQSNANKIKQYESVIRNQDSDYKAKNQQMHIMEQSLKKEIQALIVQKGSFSDLYHNAAASFDSEREKHAETKKVLQEQVKQLGDKCSELNQSLAREKRKGSNESQELKKMADLKGKQAETKIKGLEEEGAQKDSIINKLKETIDLRNKQIKSLKEKIILLEVCEEGLRKTAKENLSLWQTKETELNDLVKNQTKAGEATRKKQLQELKNIYENKIASLKHQIRELQRQIEDKNSNLNDLKKRYEELVNKFEELFSQRAAQKSLDIKVPGWIPNIIASKSLFDVFLKNKVLQYCS